MDTKGKDKEYLLAVDRQANEPVSLRLFTCSLKGMLHTLHL
jgi:hypothetical protein